MKILLVGEFSRLHNSLKEGLVALGHEVTLVGSGDDFKQFPVDLSIAASTVSSSFVLQFLNRILSKILGLDLKKIERGYRFQKLLPQLKNYDVVQLINSDTIETYPKWQIKLYQKLFAQNKKKYLLICGEDTPIVKVLLQNNLRYSILTPYFNNPNLKQHYHYTLKYVSKKYQELYDFIASRVDGSIVSDLDYKIPMLQTNTSCHFVPNPINTDKIEAIENPIRDKIVIFHGINAYSSVKKGNVYFEGALAIIQHLYPDKVKIITATSLPYNDYIKRYNEAHIVLDQVYGFDQGYNALEAMAKGKVVFTGAETEFETHYQLTEKVAINALPDVDYLAAELSYLIENPNEIVAIGKRARTFIENEHQYIKMASRYMDVWEK